MSFTELASDRSTAPDWVITRVREQEQRAAAAAILHSEEAPLIAELHRVGLDVTTIWNVGDEEVRGRADVADILLNDLADRGYSDLLRGRVAQAVAATHVKAAWPRIAALYQRRPSGHEAVGLAVALAACAPADKLDTAVMFIRDHTLGPSRVMLLAPVTRRLRERGDALLEELEHDPELAVEARHLLHSRQVARARRSRNG